MTLYQEAETLDISHSASGGYNIKEDDTWIIDKTLDMDVALLHPLDHSILETLTIAPTLSGNLMKTLEATMNITPEIQSTLTQKINSEIDVTHTLLGNREYTLVITPYSPPNILGYRATAEWQAPYDIAEVRFKGIPSFEVGDYIQIEQEDYVVGTPWVIFRGVAIGIDKTYKKNFEETTVKAVSNDWYLTKQFCFWDEQWTENLSFLQSVNGLYYVIFFLGGMHYWSNFEDKYGLGDHWEWLTGVEPDMDMGDLIPDWESNWEAYTLVFNYPFGKRKMDAIRGLCHTCDYAFYCLYGHDTWNWGRRLGYFQSRSTIYGTGWPFGDAWRIDIDADGGGGYYDRLLEIRSRETQSTDDTKINRVAMGTQISLGEYFLVRREQEGVGTSELGIKPIEVYQGIKDWPNLVANSSELYESLRRTNITYEAKLLSLVSTYPLNTPISPGMQIHITNVAGHPEDIFRVKKIIHERSGGEPIAITTIEYQDFDLIKGGSPKLNEIESILCNEEDKVEKGDKILGYPAKDPRSLAVGEKSRVGIGEVVSYNESENEVDIKLYNTDQVLKKIPVMENG